MHIYKSFDKANNNNLCDASDLLIIKCKLLYTRFVI